MTPLTMGLLMVLAQQSADGGSRRTVSSAFDGGVLNEVVLKGLFRDSFEPLQDSPPDPLSEVADFDQVQQAIAEHLGVCPIGEGRDEFDAHDCQERVQKAKGRALHLVLVKTLSSELTNHKGEVIAARAYDFRERRWRIPFDDDLTGGESCTQPGLTVFRPKMPAAVGPECREIIKGARECGVPSTLPRDFTRFDLLVPMDETEARTLREVDPRLFLLVSLRTDTAWSRSFTRPIEGASIPDCHRGALVRVHAAMLEWGTREWRWPEWFRPTEPRSPER